MKPNRTRSAAAIALVAVATGGCSMISESTVLDGAVADLQGSQLMIAGRKPPRCAIGDQVTVYQRVEQASVNPTMPPWHLLKPVATGRVVEVSPRGARVEIETGSAQPQGETLLRVPRWRP